MEGLNSFLTLLLIGSYGVYLAQASTQHFDGCSPGKYYWRHDDPTTYFVCMPFSKQAYEMKCGAGTYMCKKPATRFAPCSCNQKELVAWGTKDGLTVVNTKIDSTYGGGEEVENIAYNFLKKVDSGVIDGVREIPRINPSNSPIKDMGVDAGFGLGTDNPRGNEVNVKYIMNGREVALNDDGFSGRTRPDSTGCKMLGPPEVDTVRYMGDAMSQFKTRKHCIEACRTTMDCWGVSWDKMDPAPLEGRCYFLKEFSFMIPKNKDKCCDVYEKMDCKFTQADTTTFYPSTTPSTTTTSTTTTTTTTTTNSPPTTTTEAELGADDRGNTFYDSQEKAFGRGTPLPVIPSTTEIPTTTTTIPDTGCPYVIKRIDGKSHPFGTIKPRMKTMEGCKDWCIMRSFCKGVDFNGVTQTCYYFREVVQSLIVTNPDVVHFQKVGCGKPLNCWSHTSQGAPIVQVTDPNIPQVQCSGMCYSKEIIGTNGPSTIERGCLPASGQKLGCDVQPDNLVTITCYCDTDMCNGLSIFAQSSQTLYLPLNSDFNDHSGLGRESTVADSYDMPSFSCLDRVTNCSAVFTGSQCLAVKSLQSTQWGPVNNNGIVVPAASFAVWFKRRSGSSSMQGIFGNSMDATEPSWQIVSQALPNYVGGGVLTNNMDPSNIMDYSHVSANDDMWHLAVMTYDGRNNPTNGQFPMLQFYLDGKPSVGNAMADDGDIAIRSQPVTVGCVKNLPFTGFIDEVRIFTSVLDQNDIQALMMMRDKN